MANPPSASENRRAFTLAELLFALVLVALLAVFLITASQKVLKNARDVRCANNLRNLVQLGLGYAADHNGSVLNTFDPTWYVTLGLYRPTQPSPTNPEAYFCPVNPLRSIPGTTAVDGRYGLNYGYAYGLWNSALYTDSFKLTRLTRPNLKVIFSDGVVSDGSSNPSAKYSIRSDDISSLSKTAENYFHDGAMYIGFYDGSVRRVPMNEVDYRWWGMSYQQ